MIEIMDSAEPLAKEVLDGVDHLNRDLLAVITAVEMNISLLDKRE